MKGIIFDMDGLMIDTEKLLQKYWCEAANECGYPMKMEHVLKIRSLSGKYASSVLKELLGEDFDYSKVRAKRMEKMAEHVEKYGLEKKRGLDELLQYAKRKGYRLAVATSTDIERTTIYLKKIGVYSYFEVLVCGNMVQNGKPKPDIYIEAAKPARSPTTPPPTATTASLRVKPALSIAASIYSRFAKHLLSSPSGTVI